jgi:L-arabinokinase
MKALDAAFPTLRIDLVTRVPAWFWEGCPINGLFPENAGPCPVETGGTTDSGLSRDALKVFTANSSDILEREILRIGELRPDAVISDIDPLPFEAALRLGVPSFGIASFTWDWIFREMFPDMKTECDLLQRLYQSGTYLRLPLGPRASPFHETIDVPLVPGGGPGDPEKGRRITGSGKLCLVALRDPGRVHLNMKNPGEWKLVSSLPGNPFRLEHNITPDRMSENDSTFSDLVAAADVVLMKPGYGMVSSILTRGSRAIVVGRDDFPETPFLLEPLHDRPGTIVLRPGENGNLGCILDDIFDQNPPEPEVVEWKENITNLIISRLI